MLAADVPGDVAAAVPFQFVDQAPPLGNHDGLVTGGGKRSGDLQGPLFDAAAFQGRQNLDDLHGSSYSARSCAGGRHAVAREVGAHSRGHRAAV